jgi:signal peptidase I
VAVALAAGSALIVRTRVVASYRVLSASMLPALEPGDLVTVNKLAYGFRAAGSESLFGASPVRRGDVVVVRAGLAAGGPDQLVKRVIGLPGDRVEMLAGHPVINGWRVPSCDAGLYLRLSGERSERGRLLVEFLGDEAYLTVHGTKHAPAEPYSVRQGEIFVLGDNRNASADSRTLRGGKSSGLPLDAVEGRAARLLAGTLRDGRADLGQFLAPFAFDLNLHGMDTSALEAGVRRCLATRPKSANPPPVGATTN